MLRERIKFQNGFEDVIRSDPIVLLEVTKKHVIDCKETRDWVSVVPDARRAPFHFKKCENESLSDCTRRFKAAGKIFTRA